MRSRAIVVGIAVLVALWALFPLMGSAHEFKVAPNISIDKLPKGTTDAGDRVLVSGKIKGKRLCKRHRVVSLFQVTPGPDDRLGTDRSDNEGEFRFRLHPDDDMTVYAKIKRLAKINYNHRHICRRARSDSLAINVSG
jgi:hypothetical protein